MFWKIRENTQIKNSKWNTTQKKQNNTKHSKTKPPWFCRLLRHSARKRGGLMAYSTTLPAHTGYMTSSLCCWQWLFHQKAVSSDLCVYNAVSRAEFHHRLQTCCLQADEVLHQTHLTDHWAPAATWLPQLWLITISQGQSLHHHSPDGDTHLSASWHITCVQKTQSPWRYINAILLYYCDGWMYFVGFKVTRSVLKREILAQYFLSIILYCFQILQANKRHAHIGGYTTPRPLRRGHIHTFYTTYKQ